MRLIDADELLNRFCHGCPDNENGDNCIVDHCVDYDLIVTMPTVEAVPEEQYQRMVYTVASLTEKVGELMDAEPTKHGRWIVCDDLYKTIDGRVFDGYRECSVCGEMYPYFPEHNYCPNCGADMREVEDD